MKMNYIIFSFALIALTFEIYGQETYKVRNHNKSTQITETFHANIDDLDIKNGSYSYEYLGIAQAKGQYLNNEKTGKWKYSPTTDFVITGNYENDLQEGKWFYIKKQDTISVLAFSKGKFDGKQVGYFENGAIATEMNYSQGVKVGKHISYYQNGNFREVTNYENGKLNGENLFYSEDGNLIHKLNYFQDIPIDLEITEDKQNEEIYYKGNLKNGTGKLKTYTKDEILNTKRLLSVRNFKDSLLHGIILVYGQGGNQKFTGQFENGIMTGEWRYYSTTGSFDYSVEYDYSKGLTIDSMDNNLTNHKASTHTLCQMPEFYGGEMQLRTYISKIVNYPKYCLLNRIQGKVYVSFTVNILGAIENVTLAKGVHPYIDLEAMNVVKQLPYWTPGLQHQIPVTVWYTVPINFGFQ